MNHRADQCGCTQDIGMSQAHKPHYCQHGNLLVYTKPLKRFSGFAPLTEQGDVVEVGRRRKSNGFAASKAQREKVRGLPCVVCGRDRYEVPIEAAHVYPRRLAPCECADGVVPLCHEHHAAYDRGHDLMAVLIANGYRAEIAHAFLEHGAPLREVIDQVTGERWEPKGRPVKCES